MRFEESPATEEEDSRRYVVTWDDFRKEIMLREPPYYRSESQGPGEREYDYDYDGAWDCYTDLRDDSRYINVHMYIVNDSGERVLYF